ncbi:hypothetical protein B0H10DRAFT_369290 [Mycena sp. CBHHK59/15]|nr:hypothetical protein B0H10DRAFT_369290 [Mycena sp. CBHHK59/15]
MEDDEDIIFPHPPAPVPSLQFDEEIVFSPQPHCAGVMLNWSPGPIFNTYPWSVHLSDCTSKLGYRPDRFTGEGDDTRIWLRSKMCMGLADSSKAECTSCRAVLVGKAVQALETRADNAPAHTPYQYLTQTQLIQMLRTVVAEKNALQLQVFNLSKRVKRASKRMSDHKHLLFALANHDIPRLHHLIRIALKQGAGVEEIIWRIEEAAQRLYSVKSFTPDERQFMRALKRLAGRKAVFAMSKIPWAPIHVHHCRVRSS